MLKIIITIAFVLTFNASPTQAKTISMDNGNITFDIPDYFQPLSQQMIDLKFPSNRAPRFVVGNATAGTTIAYDLKPHKLPKKMEIVRQNFTTTFERVIPGLEWKENTILNLDGKEWLYLEMKSSAVDTDIYNIMLATGYKKQMLVFNFNSTVEEIDYYMDSFVKSISSIKVKE